MFSKMCVSENIVKHGDCSEIEDDNQNAQKTQEKADKIISARGRTKYSAGDRQNDKCQRTN